MRAHALEHMLFPQAELLSRVLLRGEGVELSAGTVSQLTAPAPARRADAASLCTAGRRHLGLWWCAQRFSTQAPRCVPAAVLRRESQSDESGPRPLHTAHYRQVKLD